MLDSGVISVQHNILNPKRMARDNLLFELSPPSAV